MFGKTRDRGESANRITDASPGYWSRVSEQAQRSGLKWLESEPYQKCSSDGDRSTTTARALEKGAETEGNQNHLKTPVRRERGNRLFHDVELSGLTSNVVEKD